MAAKSPVKRACGGAAVGVRALFVLMSVVIVCGCWPVSSLFLAVLSAALRLCACCAHWHRTSGAVLSAQIGSRHCEPG